MRTDIQLLGALLLTLVVPGYTHAQAPPSVVRTATAKLKESQEHYRVTGSLRAVARGDISALEEGRILDITVREGDVVKAGDVIARIDARRLEAQRSELKALLLAAEATVEQHKLELSQSQRDYARSAQLVETRAVSVEEHQHHETNAAIAEAQFLSALRRVSVVESQLDLLSVRLEDMVIRTPYDARVVTRHAEPGEWIHAGDAIVTLISSGAIEAWLDVPERYAQTLGDTGLSVNATGFAEPIAAFAAKRVADVDPRTRTFPVVLTLENPTGSLAPGTSVNAWLPVGTKEQRLTVPKDAVIRNGQSAYVFKAVEQERGVVAVQTPVIVAYETGQEVVLAGGGVVDGDRVVVEGNERLLPGATIAVAPSVGRSEDGKYALSRR